MKEIAKAFIEAQKEMNNPTKNQKNPFHKNSYADLNAVREATIPILNNHSIAVLQTLTNRDGKNFVKTVLLHVSGETIESETEIIYNKQNDAQSQGSGITYARRYGLSAMCCLGADDDDGNGASNTSKIEEKFKNIGAKKMSEPTNFEMPNETLAEKTGLVNKVKSLKSEYALQSEQITAIIQERYKVKNSTFLTVSQLKDLIDFINTEFGEN